MIRKLDNGSQNNSININKTNNRLSWYTNDIWRWNPGLGQVQTCSECKPGNWIQTLSLKYIDISTDFHKLIKTSMQWYYMYQDVVHTWDSALGFDQKLYMQLANTSSIYSPTIFGGVRVVLLCVPCRHIQLLVGGIMCYLRYLCLFCIVMSNTYCVCFCLVCFHSSCLLCTQCCQFLWIVPSVFSNV